MVEEAQKVLREIGDASKAIEDLDLTLPHDVEVDIAANQRRLLRNTAVSWKQRLAWLEKAGLKEGMAEASKQFQDFAKLIIALDAQYPDARQRMIEMDSASEKVRKEEKSNA